MSVQIINVPAWAAVKQPEFERDNWGVDHASVQWRGPADKKDAQEKFFNDNRWSAMDGYNLMRLEGYSSNIISPSFPGILLHYVGIRDGKVPPVKPIDGTSVQTATGSGIDTATKIRVSGSITYKASRTTWTWFETSAPATVSRYSTVNNPVNPFLPENIIAYQIQNEDTGRPYNSIPLSSFIAVFNSLILQTVVTTYDREPLIPNMLWACKAEVDYKFIG